jgi:hypothetical protein
MILGCQSSLKNTEKDQSSFESFGNDAIGTIAAGFRLGQGVGQVLTGF